MSLAHSKELHTKPTSAMLFMLPVDVPSSHVEYILVTYSTKKITLLRVIPTMTCWVEVVR